MEKVLLMQNKHWKQKYKNLNRRAILDKLIKDFNLRQIEIIQGIRRSGKSSIFKLLINELSKDINPLEILYVNLDDPYFIEYYDKVSKLYDLLESSEKLTGKKVKYLFLDEIQNIKNWEKFIKSIYDNEIVDKIFITGSNSYLLNAEYASLLSGRYISRQVFPFSYKEVLHTNNITSRFELLDNKISATNIVDDLVTNGSFPEILNLESEQAREILKSYYDTIILKDCLLNRTIKDVKKFKEFCFYLLSNNGLLFSYNSLSKIFNISDKTIREYISSLENSYIVNEIKHYSFSLKEQTTGKRKLYLSDNGFSQLAFAFSDNKGRKLENLVYCELQKAGYEIFYYNKNFECDFIIKKDNVIEALIQVCWELNDQNMKRELQGIKKLEDSLNPNKKIIITYNQEDEIDGIKIVPFWNYFFEN